MLVLGDRFIPAYIPRLEAARDIVFADDIACFAAHPYRTVATSTSARVQYIRVDGESGMMHRTEELFADRLGKATIAILGLHNRPVTVWLS